MGDVKMLAQVLRGLAVLSVLLVLLPSCVSTEVRDAELVCSKLNSRVLAQDNLSLLTFGTGKLSDGQALLLVEKDAAFWVKDGTVYTVNDNAETLAPNLPAAPDEITYQAVYDVVDENPSK
jgi:hypothetical protein